MARAVAHVVLPDRDVLTKVLSRLHGIRPLRAELRLSGAILWKHGLHVGAVAALDEFVEVLGDSSAHPVPYLIALERVGVSDCALTRVDRHVVHLALLLMLDELELRLYAFRI